MCNNPGQNRAAGMCVSATSLGFASTIDLQLVAEEYDHTLDCRTQGSDPADQNRLAGSGFFHTDRPNGLVQVS